MTTAQQINDEIQKEAIAFNNRIYDGLPLPEDILQKFRVGIMVGGTDKPELIKELISKDVSDLTWMQAGMVVNYVRRLPYERIFDTLGEALEYNIHLNEIVAYYNEICNKVDKDLESKRELKYKLAGLSNGTVAFKPKM